ncbi:MAG: type II toxin-antitoxin system mRNA interferase toxin, RelE/StbE family [Bdellovibrionales bacterium]
MKKVFLKKQIQKDLKKLPRYIVVSLDKWIRIIDEEGYENIKKIKGYKDHALKGNRKNQRSSYLSKSYRVIYQVTKEDIEILEVNKHEYKK